MTNSAQEPLYPLKTAASRIGLSPRTLRLYEEAGLIEPARVGGNDQRLYSDQDLQWLRCIRDMIHGEKLTVPAIRRLLDLIPCWEIRHCSAEQAEICRPGMNIPNMAGGGAAAREMAPCGPEHGRVAGIVELKLIYGVKEFGAILPCSRCAERHEDGHRLGGSGGVWGAARAGCARGRRTARLRPGRVGGQAAAGG